MIYTKNMNKYQYIVRIICVVFSICFVDAFAHADITAIIKSASEYDYPPFCIVTKDGKADGFSVELLRAALEKVDVGVEIKVGSWAEIKDELKDGKIRVLPLVGRTPEREAIYDFTFTYLTLHGAIFVRKGNTEIQTVDDLADKEIIVMQGDNAEEYVIRDRVSPHIILVETYEKAMKLLESGKHDAVIAQRLMGIQLLKNLGISEIVPLEHRLDKFRQDFSFAVREGDKELLALLNEGLSIVMIDGTFQRLHEKWFAPILGNRLLLKDVLKYVLIIGVPIILLALILFTIYLRAEVNRKTKGLFKEIEERKKSSESLLASEAKFRTYYENAPLGYQSLDENGCFNDVNKAWLETLKYSRDEVIGRSFANFLAPGYLDKFRKNFPCFKADGQIRGIEFEMLRKDGSHVTVSFNGNIGYSEDGSFKQTHCLLQDISELKKLEEEQQKIHKLESIGILAGGIAHDFNNILSGILNNIYLSKMHINHGSKEYKNLETAEKAIYRATDLTRQLLTFSRGGTPIKKTASIIDIVKESAEFALKGSNVKCEYSVADDIWPVEVDEGQINQVIHNFILNANQAMPEGGTIRISLDNLELSPGTVLPLQEGRYIKVVIHDQGIGLDKEHLMKIFDPYYTTKEAGRGLGLSITYSIINQHAGYISAESEVGVGTTFTFYLPASEKQIKEKETVEDAPVAGEGRILIMDDEEIIRESVGELLTINGFKVEFAKDGVEAIEHYKKALKTAHPFNVVVLDLTIRGGIGGKETVKKLHEIDPDVKAIVSSGFSSDPVMANFKEYGFRDVFNKASDSPDNLCRILNKVIKNDS